MYSKQAAGLKSACTAIQLWTPAEAGPFCMLTWRLKNANLFIVSHTKVTI